MARVRRTPRPPLPRFAVAWFPAFRGIEQVEEFRRRHDPVASLIPAHVSLVFPFATALTPLQVETHVKRVVSRWPPVPVTFRAVRPHANEFVFLMASRGAASIVELHDRLYTRSIAQHLRPEFGYEPHITIARHADIGALGRAVEEARETFGQEFTDVMREVALLAVGSTGRIARLGTYPLHCA
ncbi:MAG TPA: 2'-5' RNA ligase family protein [Usitatibacter sp.]|jgi:2'-5' RNA ligase|nr:2'-5' RNA ligase family protein [Usitatibacter sp.]